MVIWAYIHLNLLSLTQPILGGIFLLFLERGHLRNAHSAPSY